MGKICYSGGGLAYVGSSCDFSNLTAPKGLLASRRGQGFDPTAVFADEDSFKAELIAGRIMVFQNIVSSEDASTEPTEIETSDGTTIVRRDGLRGYTLSILNPLKYHKEMRKLNDGNWDVWPIDENNIIICKSSVKDDIFDPTTDLVTGIPAGFFNVRKRMNATEDAPPYTQVKYIEKRAYDEYLHEIEPGFDILETYGIEQVKITLGTVSTGVFTILVQSFDAARLKEATQAIRTGSITDLLAASIRIVHSNGNVIDVANIAVAESATVPGSYTVTTTTDTAVAGDSVSIQPTTTNMFISEASILAAP